MHCGSSHVWQLKAYRQLRQSSKHGAHTGRPGSNPGTENSPTGPGVIVLVVAPEDSLSVLYFFLFYSNLQSESCVPGTVA